MVAWCIAAASTTGLYCVSAYTRTLGESKEGNALTNEELALQVQQGEPGALDALLQRNGGVLRRVAWRLYYSIGAGENHYGFDYEDCKQIAFMGLHGAAMAYDNAKSFTLLGHAGSRRKQPQAVHQAGV